MPTFEIFYRGWNEYFGWFQVEAASVGWFDGTAEAVPLQGCSVSWMEEKPQILRLRLRMTVL
jgi:hypothetical protein